MFRRQQANKQRNIQVKNKIIIIADPQTQTRILAMERANRTIVHIGRVADGIENDSALSASRPLLMTVSSGETETAIASRAEAAKRLRGIGVIA